MEFNHGYFKKDVQNRFFDPTLNNDDYKLNNYQALRAMYEIIKNRGKLPLDQTLYKYVTKGFPGESAENAESLTKKVQKFAEAWKTSPEEAKESVEKIVKTFFEFWISNENDGHYVDAMRLYRTNGSNNNWFPTYFNVERYLDALLDINTATIRQLPDRDNRDYYDLIIKWAKDLRENEQSYYGENS